MLRLKLTILITDPPIVTLRLGSTLVVDDIKESDDIYFECDIKANPPWRKLSWLHDVSDDDKDNMEIKHSLMDHNFHINHYE